MSATVTYATTAPRWPDSDKVTLDRIYQQLTLGAAGSESLITVYETTRPRFTDGKKILKEKYLQCLRNGPTDGGLTQTITYADTELRFADTEAIVLAKILQNCNGG